MTFENPLPWWGLAAAAGVCVVVAWAAYRRSPLTPVQRTFLSVLRGLTLAWLVLCLMRPVGSAGRSEPRWPPRASMATRSG